MKTYYKATLTRNTVRIFTLLAFFLFTVFFHLAAYELNIDLILIRIFCSWLFACCIVCLNNIYSMENNCNFAFVLIALSFLFFYSQHIYYALGFDISRISPIVRIFNNNINSQAIINGTFFPLECIILICTVFCYYFGKDTFLFQNLKKVQDENVLNKIKAMRIVSKAIFIIVLIPTMYLMLYSISAYQLYGYSEMKFLTGKGLERDTILFFAVFLSGWFEPSCYMLWVSSEKKTEVLFAKSCLLLYSLFFILAGVRYRVLQIACGYILIDKFWRYDVEMHKRKNNVSIMILVAIVIVLFAIVRYYRVSETGALDYELFSFQVIADAILGDTIATSRVNVAVMEYTQLTHEYGNGISYLYGIASIFPFALRDIFFDQSIIDTTRSLLSEVSGTTTNSLGSSFCAEAFYNFGWFAFILMGLYGRFLSKIVAIQNSLINRLYPIKFILYVYICTQIVFCVRSEISYIFRPIIYYMVFPLCIVMLISKRRITR